MDEFRVLEWFCQPREKGFGQKWCVRDLGFSVVSFFFLFLRLRVAVW